MNCWAIYFLGRIHVTNSDGQLGLFKTRKQAIARMRAKANIPGVWSVKKVTVQ